MYTLHYCVVSQAGSKTPINQDSYSMPVSWQSGKPALFAVCDGMGGHMAGETAAQGCCQQLGQAFAQDTPVDIPTWLNRQVQKINKKLYAYSCSQGYTSGMGTTLTSAVVTPKHLYTANVGDSRTYLFTGHKIVQLTADHSEAWQLYQQGRMTKKDILTYPRNNIVTRAIALDKDVVADILEYPQLNHYVLLLCTDGLSDVVWDNDIATHIMAGDNLTDIANSLVNTARQNGGKDDITVMLVSDYLPVKHS